jgi:hypothetical protein
MNNLGYNCIIPKPYKLFSYIDKNIYQSNGTYAITFYINDKLLKDNEK